MDGRKPICIKQDVPKEVRDRMMAAAPVIREAYKSKKFTTIGNNYGNVILDGKFYRYDRLNELPLFLRPATLAKKEDENVYVFFGRSAPLSNHFFAKMKVEGIWFEHIEQFIAYKRARFSGEFDKSKEVLKIIDPVLCRTVLNEMKHKMDQGKWLQTMPEAIIPALKAKARQNEVVKTELMRTGMKKIGEAAKYDTVWGIGMALDNEDALDLKKWPKDGNLMGKAWEEVRLVIRKDR